MVREYVFEPRASYILSRIYGALSNSPESTWPDIARICVVPDTMILFYKYERRASNHSRIRCAFDSMVWCATS